MRFGSEAPEQAGYDIEPVCLLLSLGQYFLSLGKNESYMPPVVGVLHMHGWRSAATLYPATHTLPKPMERVRHRQPGLATDELRTGPENHTTQFAFNSQSEAAPPPLSCPALPRLGRPKGILPSVLPCTQPGNLSTPPPGLAVLYSVWWWPRFAQAHHPGNPVSPYQSNSFQAGKLSQRQQSLSSTPSPPSAAHDPCMLRPTSSWQPASSS